MGFNQSTALGNLQKKGPRLGAPGLGLIAPKANYNISIAEIALLT